MIGTQELSQVSTEYHPLFLEGELKEFGSAVLGWSESGLTARVVRGKKARTLMGLFDEFAAAFQFPLYFGENKDAFDECLSELEMVSAGSGYVVVITNPDEVLADEGHESFRWFAEVLESAAETWSKPVELGEWWDRPAVPFHVVLFCRRESLAITLHRWAEFGPAPLRIKQGSS